MLASSDFTRAAGYRPSTRAGATGERGGHRCQDPRREYALYRDFIRLQRFRRSRPFGFHPDRLVARWRGSARIIPDRPHVRPRPAHFRFRYRPFVNCRSADSAGNPLSTGCIAATVGLLTCTSTGDASASVADVQAMINQALGIATAAYDMNEDGVVNVVDVERVLTAALGGACIF